MKNPIKYMVVFLLLYSCNQTTYYYIPDENKPLIVNNDTIIFIDSVTQNTDTFRMYISDNFDWREKSYDEYIVIRYFRQNKLNGFKEFKIWQTSINSVKVFVDGHDYKDILYINQSDIISNIDIRGVKYPTVYQLKPASDMPDSLPNTVYYTLKYGIIRYEYKDGRKYEIMNNLMVK